MHAPAATTTSSSSASGYGESIFKPIAVERFEQLTREAAASTDVIENDALLKVLVSQWAQKDPYSAISFAHDLKRDDLMYECLRQMAQQNPDDALLWIETAKLTPQLNYIYTQVMSNFIQQDPIQAAALIAKMNPCDNKISFASQVATQLAEQDVNYAQEWLGALDGNEHKYALMGVVDRWAYRA